MKEKKCSKCGETKSLNEFGNHKNGKYGKRSICKKCVSLKYYENREENLQKNKEYAKKNKEKIGYAKKKWRESNQEKVKEYAKKRYEKNKENIRESQREYYQRNKLNIKKSRKRNRDKINETNRKRYNSNEEQKLKVILRNRLAKEIDKIKMEVDFSKSEKCLELLGCSLQQLKEHIESQWEEGMSWENHSHTGWHIDHIKPCASFDLTDESQRKECFHYSNLQPMWSEDNLKKGSKSDLILVLL